MNNRLTIQDLAGLLAEYTGKDKKNTERFLREFIQIVTDGVYADKLVKVKGLGTFKIIPVEKRESIHVHTGERFVIPAHYKFSFLPDKELREQVNRPFSIFETTELEADVDFTDVPVTAENQPEMGDEQEEESVEEVLPEVSQPVSDKPESAKEKTLPEGTAEVKEKKKTGWIGGIVALLVAGVIVFVCYLIPSLSGERKNTEKRLSADTVRTEAQDAARSAVQTAVTDTVDMEQKTEQSGDSSVVSAPKVIDQVQIRSGSRLTLIALKYYGHKLFWVYIYEYNKAVIKDPNNIPIGTVIDIPAPEMYGIDCHDRVSLEKAAVRQTEILEGGG